MFYVQPIRDIRKIAQIKNLLRGEWKIRDLLLFQMGIATALRCSDLLRIKVRDLYDADGTINDFFEIKEKKTSKTNRITITAKTKDVLVEYAQKYPEIVNNPDNFVFFRQKTFPLGSVSIGRNMAGLLIGKMTDACGLDKDRYSCHSLRKTWWYAARMNGIPLEIIQHKLNHSSLAITQRYLGITADEIAEACNKLDL